MRAVIRLLAFIVAALGTSIADSQEQWRFTGQTTGSPAQIHGAMQPIALFVHNSQNCAVISQVNTEVLPPGEIKRDASKPEGTAPAMYERWTVSYCQKARVFLVVFWTNEKGDTMFRVQLTDTH